MQIWSWLLAAALLACTASARPEGSPVDAAQQPQLAQSADLPRVEADSKSKDETEIKPEAKPDVVPDEPKINKEEEDAMKPNPVPIEPDVMTPDDSKVFPEGSLRSPVAFAVVDENIDDTRVLGEKPDLPLILVQSAAEGALSQAGPAQKEEAEKEEKAPVRSTRTARTYLPAEARGAEDGIETPTRTSSRQLTDIHLLFLSHPEHAARLSAATARRPAPGHLGHLGESRRHDQLSPSGQRQARRLVEQTYPLESEEDTEGHPRRGSLLDQDAVNDILPRTPYNGPEPERQWEQPTELAGQQVVVSNQDVSPNLVSVTTFIPTLTAVTTTSHQVSGGGDGPARVTWPLANYFPIVIQDPLLGLYGSWLTGGGLSGLVANLVEYGPEADVCGGGRGPSKRSRRARTADQPQGEGVGTRSQSGAANQQLSQEDAATEAIESVTDNPQQDDGNLREVSEDVADTDIRTEGADMDVYTESSEVESVTEDVARDIGVEAGPSTEQDTVSVENGEHGLPSEEEAYREDVGVEEDPPQVTVEKKLRKTKNKINKRVNKVVAQVGGLTKRVEAKVHQVLVESGVLDSPADQLASGHRDDAAGDTSSGPTLTRIVLRRGGVAVAGPGGIATAAFGGTAIVGPGGIAYTAPDSTAVAGPGARVVAVPSERLLDMYKAFRQANERGLSAYRPEWLGTIPHDGRLVAVGPAIYRNPPEELDKAARPAHWVFGNTRVLGLRR